MIRKKKRYKTCFNALQKLDNANDGYYWKKEMWNFSKSQYSGSLSKVYAEKKSLQNGEYQ